MHRLGNSGALPAKEDRIVCGEHEVMERYGSCGRHQDQSRCPVAIGEECRPRGMPENLQAGRIIEQGTSETPVIEQESAWLDQVDLDAEARRQPQQRTGILRNVRFEQSQPQTIS